MMALFSRAAHFLKSKAKNPMNWEEMTLWEVDTAAAAAAAKSLQSSPTLCDPKDGSTPGSPVPGILQARILKWVAISSPMHESEK